MLFLNKLLPIFMLPLGWTVILLLIGLIRKKRLPILAALVILYVTAMPFVGNRLLHRLEIRYPAVPIDQAVKVDAVVTLGGFSGPSAAKGFLPNISEAGERLEAGMILWQKKKADWLVFTGGRLPWAHKRELEGEVARRIAIARGISADKIIVTREVGNTADEAAALAALMHERGWTKILLVTTAWHMPRAARLFNKAGVNIVPFPVDFQAGMKMRLTLLDFLPRAEGLHNTEIALREWYGILFYTLAGR
jgi:uncharacterized SAM-binding protein YcdF (DUF218 family)